MLYGVYYDEYKSRLKRLKSWYDQIDEVYCACLGTHVVFNTDGFHHLIYSGCRERRDQREIDRRLSLLPLVPSIIKRSKSVIAYRIQGRNEFWRLQSTEVVVGKRVSVILRRTGKGHIIFYSVWED